MKKGRAGTMTHDYKRNGTTTLFAALNVLDGTVIGKNMQRHRHQEFIRFLNAVEAEVPAGKLIHAIVDNYATHKHPKVRAWLASHPRWTFHFTPTSASWLNAVEGFFAKLTRRRLKRGVFRSVVELQAAINRFVEETNADPKPFLAASACSASLGSRYMLQRYIRPPVIPRRAHRRLLQCDILPDSVRGSPLPSLGSPSASLPRLLPIAARSGSRSSKPDFIIGGSGGSGTLTFHGKNYTLDVGGVSLGITFGASEARLSGTVSHISRASDVEGVYGAAGAGGAIGPGGAGKIVLTNDKGAVLELQGSQSGLMVSADLGGLVISLK